MDIWDVALMGLLAGTALYLLYRSIWTKKGHCCGCSSETCGRTRK